MVYRDKPSSEQRDWGERFDEWGGKWIGRILVAAMFGFVGTCTHSCLTASREHAKAEEIRRNVDQQRRNREASEWIEGIRRGPCRDYSADVPETGKALCIRSDQRLSEADGQHGLRYRCSCEGKP